MIRRLMSILWTIAVLFTLVESKQVKEFFPGAVWPYPEYGVLLAIAFLYFVSGRQSLRIDRKYVELFFMFAGFATIYVLCSLINASMASQLAQGELLGGIGRTVLQYVIAPPLILVNLHAVFRRRRESALLSFIIPSAVELLLLVGADLAFVVNIPFPWIAKIREEVLLQSWVIIGSRTFFIPKWGGTFAESQELSFFLFLSLMLLDLWLFQAQVSGRKWDTLRLFYVVVVLLTASKAAIAGMLVYLLFRNRKYVQHKLVLFFPLLIAAASVLYLRVTFHYDTFIRNAFSYASLDERLFHVIYFFKLCASNPLHLWIGFGARQTGLLTSKAYPGVFNVHSNAVSIFAIVADSGLLGMLAYLAMIGYIAKSVDDYLPRLVIISGFVATIGMPDWSLDCYLFFLLIVFYSTSKKSRETKKSAESGHSEKGEGLLESRL
jgi:hypothetical protein